MYNLRILHRERKTDMSVRKLCSLFLFIMLISGLMPATVFAGGISPALVLPQSCNQVGVSFTIPSVPIDVSLEIYANEVLIHTENIDAAPVGAQIVTVNFPSQSAGTVIRVYSAISHETAGKYECVPVAEPPVEPPSETPVDETEDFVADPNADSDGDGWRDSADNCPLVSNANQANGWGDQRGDACDTSYYHRNGIKTFLKTDGTFGVWGLCAESRCIQLAHIAPSQLDPATFSGTPLFKRFQLASGKGWFVDVFYFGTNDQGTRVYQVNVFDSGGTLQDDGMLILIASNGAVSWVKHK